MKNKTQDQRKRLFINIGLMVFTLFTLGCCILAWFSASKTGAVDKLTMQVERKELELVSEIEPIVFPCAVKLEELDSDTAYLFNNYAVERVYEISGAGEVTVSVDCDSAETGMLGYVCDSVNTTDYFTELKPLLDKAMEGKEWTTENIASALKSINNRTVGDPANGNTQFKIVYWVEYDEASLNLEGTAYFEASYNAKISIAA